MAQVEAPPRISRLQRPADFTGNRLDTFQQVFLRHGLPGAVLGLLVLLSADSWQLASQALDGASQAPLFYGLGAVAVFAILIAYSQLRFQLLNQGQWIWIFYLGCLSLWEEWVFRVVGPFYLQELGVEFLPAVVLSNLLFAGLHYFTLRWRWQWCVLAFFGGMAFSRQYQIQGDLLLVAGVHWVATFLNTPRPPGNSFTALR